MRVRFLDMFSAYTPERDLQLNLLEAFITDASIMEEKRSISVVVEVRNELSDDEVATIEEDIRQVYELSNFQLQQIVKNPLSDKSKIVMGKDIPVKAKITSINNLNPDVPKVTVIGKVFNKDFRETKRPGFWVATINITDYTSSVQIRSFTDKQTIDNLDSRVSIGSWIKVQGILKRTKTGDDYYIDPVSINDHHHEERMDLAPQKRVELHLHTTFSNMDALCDPGTIVKKAISWKHPAIAITDHGVVQAFPNATKAKGDKIKLIYGMEAYYINDLDDRIVVHGNANQSLDDSIVCFDIETSGLDVSKEAITEIGAVVLQNGEVKDCFQTFVNPGRSLTPENVGLTGITDDMVKDAPSLKEAIHAFLSFVDGRPLAAHNAEFDLSFIRKACKQLSIPFDPTYIDSLILSQNLLPDLPHYKLDEVADALQLPSFHHHRASDDGATVGYMLIPFFRQLKEKGIHTIQEINPYMETIRPSNTKANRFPKHMILLAKNKIGLKNLYQLVTDSNLKHFRRFPCVYKTMLNQHREGLIVGSACEAGELFRAIVDHRDWNELKRIANYYDFLEIQPLCNNMFMLREGKVSSIDELKEFNRTVVKLGEELHKPVCATGDVHFMEPEEEIYRHILLDSKQFSDCDQELPLYFKTTDEMLEEFSYLGKDKAFEVVVTNTNLIANMVEEIELLPKGKLFPPRLENSEEDLNRLVWEKCHRLYGDNPPQLIVDRLNVELSSILGKYDVVYMSAQKLVQRSNEHGYLVGSRGSVGSSLVAYMSGITEVNSLPAHYRCPNCKYVEFNQDPQYGCGVDMPDKTCPSCGAPLVKDGFDIPFETFLGYGGGKVPDIDLNFSGEYQSLAHKHAIEMFGETQVFRAGTIGTVAEKTALGYVIKYLEKRGIEVSNCEKERLASGCVGVKRTTGQHPGGLVVVPDDLDVEDFCPVQHPADAADSDIITTHFEYHCMEDNLLKLDMLGHDDPTIIHMLKELTGIDPQFVPLDDKDTMSIFTSSKVLGYENDEILGPTGAVAIPEFNTKFTRTMLEETQPQNFNTLVRLSGFSHGTDVWIGNARDLIVSKTATVLETVGCRDDIMLYLISMGLEPKMSFKIMESVRKGKVKAKGFEEGWVEAMKDHDVPDWYIDSLAKIGYLFPKAHAVAYVMMAYRIAWFKVHQPLAFYAAFFSIRAKAFDAEICTSGLNSIKLKIKELEEREAISAVEEDLLTTLEVCYEFYLRGFHFEPVNIYKSEATQFVIIENGLIPPFTSLKGLGETAALATVEQRKGKSFASIEEFSDCCNKLSSNHLEQLKALGAFAGLPDSSQISFF